MDQPAVRLLIAIAAAGALFYGIQEMLADWGEMEKVFSHLGLVAVSALALYKSLSQPEDTDPLHGHSHVSAHHGENYTPSETSFGDDELKKVHQLAHEGKYAEAMETYQRLTGHSMADSKTYIEAYLKQLGKRPNG